METVFDVRAPELAWIVSVPAPSVSVQVHGALPLLSVTFALFPVSEQTIPLKFGPEIAVNVTVTPATGAPPALVAVDGNAHTTRVPRGLGRHSDDAKVVKDEIHTALDQLLVDQLPARRGRRQMEAVVLEGEDGQRRVRDGVGEVACSPRTS